MRQPLIACLLLTLLAGCATPPRQESVLAPGANPAAFRTFAIGLPPGEGADDAPLRILDTHIRNALREEFTRRGYAEVADAPELRVDYEIAQEDRVRSSPFRIGIGMGSFGGNVGGSVSMGTPDIQTYQEGRLVIHVYDAARKQELWYGSVTDKAGQRSLDAAAVARVVGLALESFPARGAVPAP